MHTKRVASTAQGTKFIQWCALTWDGDRDGDTRIDELGAGGHETFKSGVQHVDGLEEYALLCAVSLGLSLGLLLANLGDDGIDLLIQFVELLLGLDRFVGGRGRRPVVRVDDSGARTARPAKRGQSWRPKAADIGWGEATTGRGRQNERGSGGGRRERGVDPERYKGGTTGCRGKKKEEHRSDLEPQPPRWVKHVLVSVA